MKIPPDNRQVRRKRETRTHVRVMEVLSGLFITLGGIGTVLAVALIMVFLLWVVAPLFKGADLAAVSTSELSVTGGTQGGLLVDEYRVLGAMVSRSGGLVVFRLEDGQQLLAKDLFTEQATAFNLDTSGEVGLYGFADGSLRLVQFGFKTSFTEQGELDPALGELSEGEPTEFGGRIYERMAEDQVRVQEVDVLIGEPLDTGLGAAVTACDFAGPEDDRRIVALAADRSLKLFRAQQREDWMTGETVVSLDAFDVELGRPEAGAPDHLKLMGRGDNLLLIWNDGTLHRYDTRRLSQVSLAEEVDLVEDDGDSISAAAFLIGRSTLIVGQRSGRLRGWFNVRDEGEALGTDGNRFVAAHEYPSGSAAVTALTASARSRLFGAGFADGEVAVYQGTTEKRLASQRVDAAGAIELLRLAPKEDGLAALGGKGLARFEFDPGYPEAGFQAFFRPVWYEGYDRPDHVWQSSSGTDESEPKLGMIKLIFGTLKATFYSMLVATPIALLAAIFTSEYLSRKLRSRIKPLIEIMASLPSVVLGFLAALWLAPKVAGSLPAVLTSFFTLPLCVLIGAFLWQMLPGKRALSWAGLPRLAAMAGALVAGVLLAMIAAPVLEHILFAGDLMTWLDGNIGSAFGGWFFLAVPIAVLVTAWSAGRYVGPWFRRKTASLSRAHAARADLIRATMVGFAALAVAALMASLMSATGLDPRRGTWAPLSTYDPRNALVVGFVMGFAVIPIIYTLAEDALSSVPDHLRLASLGAGATPWQTAVRIIIPTAMSGLFSAVMIGLGRAVGETMIVLMATGNTPIMEWNAFNGFRTLSANIAVELPEAVQNSTHYRALFLAALILFAITFLINMLAELVRQRFRKRAYQL